MNRTRTVVLASLSAAALPLAACRTQSSMNITDAQPARAAAIAYPSPERGDVVDDYHGTKVADPYRGLEDPDSAPTVAWIEAENALTRAYIDAVPEREAIERRLAELWNYERISPPAHAVAYSSNAVVMSRATPCPRS